jgi:hypothetical protein
LPIIFDQLPDSNQRSHSVWNFYRKDLIDENDHTDYSNLKLMPKIPSESTFIYKIDELGDIAQEFKHNSDRATR